ncbi:hypothetical protein K1719_028362 [Acacia pycnantha]|nr:hypothetical protein K1719_028362 [Acacia pycnantha]
MGLGIRVPLILGTLKSLPGTPREYSFKELKKATNNFSEKNKLGEGGYGIVYKGILQKENNLEVAVKKFCRDAMKGQDDFLAELSIINRLRHKHLVRLLDLACVVVVVAAGASGGGGSPTEDEDESDVMRLMMAIELEREESFQYSFNPFNRWRRRSG